MGFGRSEGNHEYWYDPEKKEFILTLFNNAKDGKDHSYLITPENITQAAKMLDEYHDEDFSLYDMLKFLKEKDVMGDYTSVAKKLAERYSDQPPVWLDNGNIDSALGLVNQQNDEGEVEEYTCDEFANGDKDLADYLRTVLGTGKHTVEDFESVLEGYDDNSDEGEESESTDADSISIADFEDEIKELGGDVDKIVERIIDTSETTDMSSDDIEYMRDVLTQKVKDYMEDKNKNSTDVSNIAKNIMKSDVGRV